MYTLQRADDKYILLILLSPLFYELSILHYKNFLTPI